MLTNLGYEYVTGEYIGGSKFYQIKYPYSGSDYYIRLSGANDPVIWGVLELGTIEKDRPVPPSVMQSMLDENSRAIRFYFSISKDARELRLKAPLPNDTITPIKLRQFVQEAVEQVARTSAVWNMNAWPKTNIVAENADIKTMTAEGNALAVP